VGRWVSALIASILMLLVGPAASAWGDAKVRFVQTVPGAGALELHATEGGISQRVGRRLGFGQVGSYEDVPAGQVELEIAEPGGRPASSTRERLQNGARYTVVAMLDERPRVLRDGRAEGGQSHLRVMHTAPELGRVDVQLGDMPVANGLAMGDVTGYRNVGPGAYALNVMRPGGGSPIASEGAVTLTAGTSSTAFVIGTRGEPIRTIVASDRSAAPRGAVRTGLGGLAGEDPDVVLALVAGLLAALAGGGIYLTLTARSRGGDS
jgi:hypothetical protein